MLNKLLGEMKRWRKSMNKLEELLRRWSTSEEGESLDKRERSGREGDEKRKEIEEKVDEGEVEENQERKAEERCGREKGEEEEVAGKDLSVIV